MKFSEKLKQLRKTLGYSQVEMGQYLGLTATYLSALENEAREPSETLANYVQLLYLAVESGLIIGQHPKPTRDGLSVVAELPAPYPADKSRRAIPLYGWAQVGGASGVPELATSTNLGTVPTDCPDPEAFAVRLEGATEERFPEGDSLIVMPSVEFYSGCYVICRFKNDGIAFRRAEVVGEWIQLIPMGERHRISEHLRSEFSWIHPVYGRYTQLWKR